MNLEELSFDIDISNLSDITEQDSLTPIEDLSFNIEIDLIGQDNKEEENIPDFLINSELNKVMEVQQKFDNDIFKINPDKKIDITGKDKNDKLEMPEEACLIIKCKSIFAVKFLSTLVVKDLIRDNESTILMMIKIDNQLKLAGRIPFDFETLSTIKEYSNNTMKLGIVLDKKIINLTDEYLITIPRRQRKKDIDLIYIQ